ncbi:7-carboxy-7-deazaguanine synthase QueE [Geitlerinema sp. PCC 9228]|jgi:organic radical activating enzyme|uniref:7-carboxy-7-deazaguanine synthase QueE n=1 Tax=Geitlerinema sp. PCC 9228 TaxID=111611 RepID=UPI0008F9C5E8|nr:7-carboxy-7-deazaguanine synthase QueE [Geitlerinema sp. PCC 9228]
MTSSAIASPTPTNYPVVETFASIQGEGAFSGTSAFFIRLGGCDVGCWFCDTKESWNPKRHPQMAAGDLVRDAVAAKPAIVVVTGGEPLMHDLLPLTHSLRQAGLPVHLETSGAHPFTGSFDWVTLSPKRFKPPVGEIYPHVSELKVVVAGCEDLEWAEQEAAKVNKSTRLYLQPEWETSGSEQLVFDYVLEHPQWRVSLQIHKFLQVR